MYCFRNKRILKYVIKATVLVRHKSVLCCIYVVTSVTSSSLTETFIIAMLFPFCCQVSTTCKHLCFLMILKFKEVYKEVLRNELNYCIISIDQGNTKREY